jgi:hypothetical protein
LSDGEKKQRIEETVLPQFSNRRLVGAQALMRHLYVQPVTDVKQAALTIGTTINSASALIADLVLNGVLVEITGQRRNRLFLFQEYLTLFKS